MEFHIFDYSSHTQVRLSDEMVQRIFNIKFERRVLVVPKHAQQAPNWEEPKIRKPHYHSAQVRLISVHPKNPYRRIAGLLFDKNQRRRGITKPHIPFLSIRDLRTVQSITEISEDELEASVIEVRNGASDVRVAMKFPVVPNADWAWLFGYYQGCGNIHTRIRYHIKRTNKPSDKTYKAEEKLVRFTVDKRVYEKQVLPLLQRMGIGYSPNPKGRWYEKYGGHILDKQKRVGVGNQPRKEIFLPRVVREVMEKFGLYVDVPPPQEGRHRWVMSRRLGLSLPDWVKQQYPKAYIEGFINACGSSQLSSIKESRDKVWRRGNRGVNRMVQLNAGFANEEDTMTLANFFKTELEKLGISGCYHRMHHHTIDNVHWMGFEIYTHESLRKLFETFDIQQPVLRARLYFHYNENGLLYELEANLTSLDLLVIGALLEAPRTESELRDLFRLREDQVQKTVNNLHSLDFITNEEGSWRIIPSGVKKGVLTWLKQEDEKIQDIKSTLYEKFFSRCDKCGNIIAETSIEPCQCGGMMHPIERGEALRGIQRRNISKILQISGESMPVKEVER
jgi:predicted transcriptional regulator